MSTVHTSDKDIKPRGERAWPQVVTDATIMLIILHTSERSIQWRCTMKRWEAAAAATVGGKAGIDAVPL